MLKNRLFRLLLQFSFFCLAIKNPSAAQRLSTLEGKIIVLDILDLKEEYFLTIKNSKLKVIPKKDHFDVVIKGTSSTFFNLLFYRSDADELFFTRKLYMEGDIETATYLKNILAHF